MIRTVSNQIWGALSAGALVALAACQMGVETPTEPETSETEPMAECPVIESANWVAYVDRMPGPGATPTLRIRGEVTLPTPGYTFVWREGIADRMMPPAVRFVLTPTPPEGPVIQVLTTEAVTYDGPALASGYRSVFVLCGDQVLAEITDVEDVF